MALAQRKQERLEARIPSAQKKLIKQAADIRGVTLTDFVVSSAQEAATKVVQESATFRLTERDTRMFVAALLNPPVANEALKSAARRYKSRGELVGAAR